VILISTIGDSSDLTDKFCSQCEQDSINLPYACFKPTVSFEKFSVNLPFLLCSDHAPFWREGIPALELTDTAILRDPYAHTPVDTINNLDFDFMAKLCKAVYATVVEINKEA